MTLTCINPFGVFLPGDEIDVPDDAIFDTAYFRAKDKPPVSKPDKETEE